MDNIERKIMELERRILELESQLGRLPGRSPAAAEGVTLRGKLNEPLARDGSAMVSIYRCIAGQTPVDTGRDVRVYDYHFVPTAASPLATNRWVQLRQVLDGHFWYDGHDCG